MGLSLTLLPFQSDTWSQTVLPLIEYRELFEELQALPSTPVPADFNSYLSDAGDGYGITTEDAFGAPLGYVTAYVLYGFADHPGAQNGHENRAAWAYLAQLPPQTPVALYWS